MSKFVLVEVEMRVKEFLVELDENEPNDSAYAIVDDALFSEEWDSMNANELTSDDDVESYKTDLDKECVLLHS